MKKLFYKLSEDNQKLLENLEYKSTQEKLITILKKEELFTFLPLGVCLELYFLLVPAKPFSLETFGSLFYE